MKNPESSQQGEGDSFHFFFCTREKVTAEKAWGLMYKRHVCTKTHRTLVFRCTKSDSRGNVECFTLASKCNQGVKARNFPQIFSSFGAKLQIQNHPKKQQQKNPQIFSACYVVLLINKRHVSCLGTWFLDLKVAQGSVWKWNTSLCTSGPRSHITADCWLFDNGHVVPTLRPVRKCEYNDTVNSNVFVLLLDLGPCQWPRSRKGFDGHPGQVWKTQDRDLWNPTTPGQRAEVWCCTTNVAQQ